MFFSIAVKIDAALNSSIYNKLLLFVSYKLLKFLNIINNIELFRFGWDLKTFLNFISEQFQLSLC